VDEAFNRIAKDVYLHLKTGVSMNATGGGNFQTSVGGSEVINGGDMKRGPPRKKGCC